MEAESVNIFSKQKGNDDRTKLRNACAAFACEPWLAVYVETSKSADLYLTSLDHYDRNYRSTKSRTMDTWKMGAKDKRAYDVDPNVRHISAAFSATNWTWHGDAKTIARYPMARTRQIST